MHEDDTFVGTIYLYVLLVSSVRDLCHAFPHVYATYWQHPNVASVEVFVDDDVDENDIVYDGVLVDASAETISSLTSQMESLLPCIRNQYDPCLHSCSSLESHLYSRDLYSLHVQHAHMTYTSPFSSHRQSIVDCSVPLHVTHLRDQMLCSDLCRIVCK